MTIRKLPSDEVGVLDFAVAPDSAGVFALSSHARAKEALKFGLHTDVQGFNIFVVGAERSGRLTETVAYVQEAIAKRPPADDWLYLNNFRRSHRPKPCRVSAGTGRRFRDSLATLLPCIRDALKQAFGSDAHQATLQAPTVRLQEEINRQIAVVKATAEARGLTITQGQSGPTVTPPEAQQAQLPAMTPEDLAKVQADAQEVANRLSEITRWASSQQPAIAEHARTVSRQIADQATRELIDGLAKQYDGHVNLLRWLDEMRADVLDNIQLFLGKQSDGQSPMAAAKRQYAVNLFVDNGDNQHPLVVLEPNPTYENIFGRVQYRQTGQGYVTDFSLLCAGALHRANGGVLILRAEALAAQPNTWQFLKGALRDGEIQIEDLRQQAGVMLAGAPRPKPIELNVKVVVIGAPKWFHTFFSTDVDFQTHFRVKAEIDHDMPADDKNAALYAGLMQDIAKRHGAAGCAPDAINELLGIASRYAGDRTRLSSQFEMLEDIIAETCAGNGKSGEMLSGEGVARAKTQRRNRNSRIEDMTHERIADGTTLIQTTGGVIGQVNGLTVRSMGHLSFGGPSRVTARASVGRGGIINIERDVDMGGPIQQKAAMILQGFLAGHFARTMPMSFTCSITFEQNYGGVEGDSASLAGTVAIISELAEMPARQDIAITGSMNQRGEVQVVGGVVHKVEGFFRTCQEAPGGLTGSQGAVIPRQNAKNLVVRKDVVEAIEAGLFHLYVVDNIADALEVLLSEPGSVIDESSCNKIDDIYEKVTAKLSEFNDHLLVASRLEVVSI
jgi:predicted ATP-dependent protease